MGDDERAERDGGSKRPPPRSRIIGRRVGQVLHWSVAVAIAVAATVQVSQQVFFPSASATPPPFRGCDDGLRALLEAIHQATAAAESHTGDATDEAALERFRHAIAPMWAHRDALEEMCQGSGNEALLDALERLRYSEEHGVRHQAAELTALRRRVSRMVAARLDTTPPAAPAAEGSVKRPPP
jgi:hypothetical protein